MCILTLQLRDTLTLMEAEWVTGASSLPNTIRLIGAFNDFDGDDPWKENSQHKQKYKPVKQTKTVNTSDVKKVEKTVNEYDSKSSKGGGKKNKITLLLNKVNPFFENLKKGNRYFIFDCLF